MLVFNSELAYVETKTCFRKQRWNVVLFNSPFSKHPVINIKKICLLLLAKYFPLSLINFLFRTKLFLLFNSDLLEK